MTAELQGIDQAVSRSRETQLRFVMSVSARRWKMITAFTVAVAIFWGMVAYMRNPPRTRFLASTDVVVKDNLGDQVIRQVVGGAPLTAATPKALIQLVGKRELAEEVARALVQKDLASRGGGGSISKDEEYAVRADSVQGALDVRDDPANAGLIHLVARSADQNEASSIADFAARVFTNRARQMQVEQEEQTYDIVKNQLEELRTSLEKAENAVWEFRKQPGFQTQADVQQYINSLNTSLRKAELDKQETQEKLTHIESELKLKNQQMPKALGQITDGVINKLVDELNGLVQKQLESDYLPNSAPMQDLQADIEQKSTAIMDAVAKQQEAGGGAGGWEELQGLRKQYTQLQLDQSRLDIQIATAKRLLEVVVQDLPVLANKNHQYEQLIHESEQVRAQFHRVLEKEFDIRTSMGRGSGQVLRNNRVIVSGERPPVQSWFNFALGAGVGFLMGIVLAFAVESLDTSIRSLEDVSDHIGIEVIGTIPKMKFGKGRAARRHGAHVPDVDEEEVDACIVTQHDPKSPISEAYRTLRTNFQFATIQQKPKTLMVTSAVPGEGKTTTAVNLAVTMADRGIRVLLIDTDLRRPNVHRVLKVERGPGLSDVLRESLDVHTVIRKTRIENLSIISSGRVPPNPSELIASERMQHLLTLLGREFDLVVCDAPSILVVTDPVLLATHMDTVILVVSVNNARRETIQRAKKLLETAKANVAGVVLNGLEATRRHYYYYYYYYDDAAGGRTRRWYHL
jgi:capsular exopolysaccharide synthesis family protein